MYELLKKHWVMSIIGAAIAIAAVAVLLYCIITSEGDNGFLQGRNGDLQWAKGDIPLTCICSASVDMIAIEQARVEVNDAIGSPMIGTCSVWAIDEEPRMPIRGGIYVTYNPIEDEVSVTSPYEREIGGSTHLYSHRGSGALYGAVITLERDVKQDVEHRVITHELLHALGLAHDRLRESIMYPSVDGSRSQVILPGDIERLREAYR